MTDTLWVTDEEIVERLGVPADVARVALKGLDANPLSGFPKKQKLWGDKRYWPAVREWFDAGNMLKMGISQPLRRVANAR